MAETVTKTLSLLRSVTEKNKNGTLGNDVKIGASVRDVVDDRYGKTPYTVAQIIDNYFSFMKNTTFVHTGDTQPANTHIGIWIDTSVDNFGNSTTIG